jgi:hypothetical protein
MKHHLFIVFIPKGKGIQMSFKVDVLNLKPTQFCLGFFEIDERIEKLLKMKKEDIQKYLEEKIVPVIIGPKNNHYMIDRHHLVRSCWEVGIDKVVVNVVANLSHLNEEEFWDVMKKANWCYLYDQFGNGPHSEKVLPENVRSMGNDPYRSVSWALRENKVYIKEGNNVPFIEFYWANSLRKKIIYFHGKEGMKQMIKESLELVKKDSEMQKLPGYNKNR